MIKKKRWIRMFLAILLDVLITIAIWNYWIVPKFSAPSVNFFETLLIILFIRTVAIASKVGRDEK